MTNEYIPFLYCDKFVALRLVRALHLKMRLQYDCETMQVVR